MNDQDMKDALLDHLSAIADAIREVAEELRTLNRYGLDVGVVEDSTT